jgi:hypothetical protein
LSWAADPDSLVLGVAPDIKALLKAAADAGALAPAFRH